MLPRYQSLLLKDKIVLYNNLAEINDCKGRLLAELQVFPSPRLTFEFEILGEQSCFLPFLFSGLNNLEEIRGYGFSIKKPCFTSQSNDIVGPKYVWNGTAFESVYGQIDELAHSFEFYLPNCRVQHISDGQNNLDKIVEESNTGKEIFRGEGYEGKYIEFSLDEKWNISLEITKDALDWLNQKNKNIGTLITTRGKLYQSACNYKNPETCLQLEEMKTEDAFMHLDNLSLLLSFANGGFLSPLYMESLRLDVESSRAKPQSAHVKYCQITPIERLGVSWVTEFSDLKKYLSCLNSFAKMQQKAYWRDTFKFVLIQYFQAVQYDYTYWPIQASSLGAALERLSYTILVEEESNDQLKNAQKLLFDNSKKTKSI